MPTILQLAKLATPALADTVLLAQLRVAPVPGWAAMPTVTCAFDVVTVLPLESSMVTTGWLAKATPSTPPLGALPNSTLAAVPAVMVTFEEFAVASPLRAALKVYVPAPWVPVILQLAKLATPALADTVLLAQPKAPLVVPPLPAV